MIDNKFKKFKECLFYTDYDVQVRMFDFAKRQDGSLFPIHFSNQAGMIYEWEIQGENIMAFINDEKNQRILFEWLEKQGADLGDLDDIIHGNIRTFEKPVQYKYYVCTEKGMELLSVINDYIEVECLKEKIDIENSNREAYAIVSFDRKLSVDEEWDKWQNSLMRAYDLEIRPNEKK